MSSLEFWKGLIHLARPAEWTKSFGNMVLAVITAYYAVSIQPSLYLFLLGFFSVAFLWSSLYTLNDYTDFEADKLHPVKRARPIPSGKVSPKIALAFSMLLLFLSFLLGSLINLYFVFALTAMLVNQVLYTLEPFSFKKKKVLDLISGSLVNPYFRFYAGWFIFMPAFNAPLLMVLFVVLLQFGGYTLYRLTSKQHEINLGYKSSVVAYDEKFLKNLCYIAIAIGCLSFVLMPLNSFLNMLPKLLGFLPLKFASLIFLSLIFAPFYSQVLTEPTKANIKKLYKLVYLHYLIFIALFFCLWYFLP